MYTQIQLSMSNFNVHVQIQCHSDLMPYNNRPCMHPLLLSDMVPLIALCDIILLIALQQSSMQPLPLLDSLVLLL